MRAYEFEKSIDVLMICHHEAQIFLMKNPHIITESAYDFKEFRNIVDQEKTHTFEPAKLNKGDTYAPMFIYALPIAKYLKISIIDNDATFISHGTNVLYFRTGSYRDITFPDSNQEIGDVCTDTLIFKTLDEQKHFLSILNLTYGDWTIETIKLN